MEEKNKINILWNKTHGFSETDVVNCSDLHQLRRWLFYVRKDIAILENKIASMQAEDSSDRKRKVKLQSSKKFQEHLAEIIKNRINELMENNKEFYQFEINFFEQARKMVDKGEMDSELFDRIILKAQGYEEI